MWVQVIYLGRIINMSFLKIKSVRLWKQRKANAADVHRSVVSVKMPYSFDDLRRKV